MPRTTWICGTPGADDRRWLSASRIAACLPRDQVEFLSPTSAVAAGAGRDGPVVLLVDSGDPAASTLLTEWSRRGAATAVVVVDPTRPLRVPAGVARVFLVESRWSAEFLLKAHGVVARVVDPRDVRPRPRRESGEARYATFFDPVAAHGVDLFVRLADELGRRRPDIPLLVVEGRGTESDLVARGVDLRGYGNVQVMAGPVEPCRVWRAARLAIAPVLDPWVGGFLGDAPAQGVPAVVSDLPPLREVLAEGAVFAPIPGWMTPGSRRIPTAGDVQPWFEAVARLWDEGEGPGRGSHRDRSSPARGADIGHAIAAHCRSPAATPTVDRGDWAVLVPFMDTIEPECESGLAALERAGVRVVRCRGSSAIDHARSMLASEAVRRGSSAVLFIDSDIAFEPNDALRLLARAEPVVAGIYTKKNAPALTSVFPPENPSVIFGAESPGLYPLKYAAAGFLRIRTTALRRMIDDLPLPRCSPDDDDAFWPFFLPLVIPQDGGSHRYLAEDWAFSHRLGQVGITPLADTTIRLSHVGKRGYTWEDALKGPDRFDSFTFNFSEPPRGPAPG